MELSIVILKYKSKGLMRQCLKAIRLLRLSFPYEVIVVDNASFDGSAEMVARDFPGTIFIQSDKNLGYAGGNNLGLKRSAGRYVMIVNPDILMVTNELEKMISYLDAHPRVGMLGPKLINPDGSTQMSCYHFPSFFMPFYRRTFLGKLPWFKKKVRQYLMVDWDHAESREVDWLLGGCLLIRREAMERVGLLDERFWMYFDDVDYCRRFWEAGFPVVYFAPAEVVHYHQRTSAETWWLFGLFNKVAREHIKSWLKYFAKYFGARHPWRAQSV
ncbi:glycosyltransferase family 2 protein [Candidatus Falkowbacteria bacterium]|nr:glycosyltransferase family 2 protein [Candidatus Falkowbacteria bacterium]